MLNSGFIIKRSYRNIVHIVILIVSFTWQTSLLEINNYLVTSGLVEEANNKLLTSTIFSVIEGIRKPKPT